MRGRTRAAAAVLAALLAGSGCSVLEPRADPTRHYVLTPVVEIVSSPPHLGTIIAVGPVELPSYLDRPQMVTRAASNQVQILEFERWAEPLPTAFARVLEQNLAAQLGTSAIVGFPASGDDGSSLRLEVDVLRFEANASNEAELAARWSLRDPKSRRTLLVRDSAHRLPIGGGQTADAVRALSESVGELSGEISRAILLLPGAQDAKRSE